MSERRVEDVVIVGGGIGGMTLAACLRKRGVQARVIERAVGPLEPGAGLGLWANATRVLLALGLGARLDEVAQRMDRSSMVTCEGKVLRDMTLDEVAGELGGVMPLAIMHRAELLELITGAVDPAQISYGVACAEVIDDGDQAVVRLDDGEEIRARVVVGADGLWSRVRASIHGEQAPDYAGEPCWRGIVPLSALPDPARFDMGRLSEVQGEGKRVGICPLSGDRIYWWATHPAAPGTGELPVGERAAFLAARFGHWAQGVPDLMASTRPEDMVCHDLYDRPALHPWSKGVITLLGDAAHPTTPNLGQGACMAIEDAAMLGELLSTDLPVPEVLHRYERARRPRCAQIVSQSRQWGKIGQWSNPLAQALRETINSKIPDAALRASFRKLIAYDVYEAAAPLRIGSSFD